MTHEEEQKEINCHCGFYACEDEEITAGARCICPANNKPMPYNINNLGESFVECNWCANKPGTPVLCHQCLHNRSSIWSLQSKIEKINTDRQEAYNAGRQSGLEELSKKVVVYFEPDSNHNNLSHEDRIKLNAYEGTIFLADTVKKVWGDDWNEAPDDCNSGQPYGDTMKNPIAIKIKLGEPLEIINKLRHNE